MHIMLSNVLVSNCYKFSLFKTYIHARARTHTHIYFFLCILYPTFILTLLTLFTYQMTNFCKCFVYAILVYLVKRLDLNKLCHCYFDVKDSLILNDHICVLFSRSVLCFMSCYFSQRGSQVSDFILFFKILQCCVMVQDC